MEPGRNHLLKRSAVCPPAALWSGFLRGDVDQPTLESLSQHLNDCSDCLELVETLSSQSIGRDRTVIRSPYLGEQHCERLLERASLLQLTEETVSDFAGDQTRSRDAEPLPEQLGRYLVRSLLGSGGFGRVYQADDPLLQRSVAIKVPRRAALGTEADVSNFLEEARRAAALDHPHIVPIFDVLTANDQRVLIVMKHIDGKSLAEVRRQSRLRPEVAVSLVIQIARAVHFAHERDFMHRDLKPSNIVIDANGAPHVTDFGLSIRHSELSTNDAGRGGTPNYMAPEQVRHDVATIDRRADVWALGVLLAELIHDKRPFPQRDRTELFHAIQFAEPQLGSLAGSEELNRIIRRCLAKSPADRFATAETLATELTRWLRRYFPKGWDRWRFGWRRNVAVAAGVTAVALGVWWNQVQSLRASLRVTWRQLESAPAAQIPTLVTRLRESNSVSASLWPNDVRTDASGQFRLDAGRLALGVHRDDTELQATTLARFLDHIPSASYDEIVGALRALETTDAAPQIARLAAARLQDSSTGDVARLKFAATIAELAPEELLSSLDRSTEIVKWLTDCSVEELVLRLPLFDRVGATQLAEPLRTQMTSSELPREVQTNSARSLARFVATDVARLAQLVTEADNDELAVLTMPLQAVRAEAVQQLRRLFETIHAQPRTVPTDDFAPPTVNDVQSSRLAIALWQLGDTTAARKSLRHDPNPTLQTLVIHGLAQQAVSAESLLSVLREVQNQHNDHAAAIKFGLLQTLGLLPSQQVRPHITASWLTELWQRDPDSGVHATVGWLAQRLDYELPKPSAGEHGRWLFDRTDEFEQTFAIVEPHVAELGIHDQNQAPYLTIPWPRHVRRFPRRFAIAIQEITIEQFRRFDRELHQEDRMLRGSSRNAAMMRMTLDEAYRFCNWCSERFGLPHCYETSTGTNGKAVLVPKPNHLSLAGYRLPTDGEWECACRAGTGTSRFFGQTPSLVQRYGWMEETPAPALAADGSLLSQPVALFLPNRWGLFDTYGSAKEICETSLAPTSPQLECTDELTQADLAASRDRPMLRGGSLEYSGALFARSVCRTDRIVVATDRTVGFRLARTIPQREESSGFVSPEVNQ